MTRRDLLFASAASLAMTRCARPPKPKPLVSITKASGYHRDLAGQIRRILVDHKVPVRGKRILLKPNLVEFDTATTINTDPRMVQAAYEAFHSLGATQVRIAEGPGHRRNTLELAEGAGYFEAIPDFERRFTDLNLDEVSRVSFPRPVSRLRLRIPAQTTLAADLLVSMPKMKTHHWVGATLSMKNFFGLVPGAVYGWPKNILHWSGIHECIADLHSIAPKHFAIVDGIIGMEGNGPIQGTPKAAGVIVSGSDLVAVDATCCRIMGIDPVKIRYLKLAEDRSQTAEQYVQQIGEPIRSVQTRFELIREFQSMRLET